MKNDIIKVIGEIRKDKSLFFLDEASIKSGIILRFLSLLGWDPFNINEVKPEYTIETKRVDFSLRIGGINKAFLEVKRPAENLEQHQEQLLNYSFREGVKLAVLTNGKTWWFYLPLHEGNWEERRFFAVDFFEQDADSIASRFIDLLSKISITSGDAIKKAEDIYKNRKKNTVLKEAIPKAWDKIINDPDDLLVDLLIETTEKLSGFRPEVSDVEQFLDNLPQKINSIQAKYNTLSQTNHNNHPSSSSTPQTVKTNDNYINKTVQSIIFFDTTYYPRTWKEILVQVSKEMYSRHSSDFDRCLGLRGSKMSYFSVNPNELSQPFPISNSKYFVETKLNANSIVKRSQELMALFGYKEDNLKIIAV
ncbi:MAG: restriction endonuclease subunit R [Deltaproteobacteria bacterium]|nr:restriction endonuclease subunit R [Deltaproteobacteria bacterium]